MTEPVNTEAPPRANLKATWILCLALIVGASVFALIAILVNQFNGPAMPEEGQQFKLIFTCIVAAVALLCIFRSVTIYRKGIVGIKNSSASLNDKLNQYRSVMIPSMALCEFPALFSVIVFYLTGDYIVFIVTAVMLLAMLIRMPQKRKIIRDFDLSFQEQQELE